MRPPTTAAAWCRTACSRTTWVSARIQPSSVQGFSGCEFSGNSVPRIRVNSGTTSAGGMMENMVGLDSWGLDNGDVMVPAV